MNKIDVDWVNIGDTLLLKYSNSLIDSDIHECILLQVSDNQEVIKVKLVKNNKEKWLKVEPNLVLIDKITKKEE